MKQALYVDFDGTVTVDRYWRSLPNDMHIKIQELFFGTDKTMVGDWMRGKYTAEEINEYASNVLGVPYSYLWDVFVSDCERIRVSQVVLDKIKLLRDRYMTILITVNMDSFSRFTVPALQLDKYFDNISNSFYEKIQKTDDGGILFLKCAERAGIPLSNSILIDDNQTCCDLFSAHGGRAYRVVSPTDTERVLDTLS